MLTKFLIIKKCLKSELNNIRVQYRKEIKLEETVKCRYTREEDKHIITIISEDEKNIHAIIELM